MVVPSSSGGSSPEAAFEGGGLAGGGVEVVGGGVVVVVVVVVSSVVVASCHSAKWRITGVPGMICAFKATPKTTPVVSGSGSVASSSSSPVLTDAGVKDIKALPIQPELYCSDTLKLAMGSIVGLAEPPTSK